MKRVVIPVLMLAMAILMVASVSAAEKSEPKVEDILVSAYSAFTLSGTAWLADFSDPVVRETWAVSYEKMAEGLGIALIAKPTTVTDVGQAARVFNNSLPATIISMTKDGQIKVQRTPQGVLNQMAALALGTSEGAFYGALVKPYYEGAVAVTQAHRDTLDQKYKLLVEDAKKLGLEKGLMSDLEKLYGQTKETKSAVGMKARADEYLSWTARLNTDLMYGRYSPPKPLPAPPKK